MHRLLLALAHHEGEMQSKPRFSSKSTSKVAAASGVRSTNAFWGARLFLSRSLRSRQPRCCKDIDGACTSISWTASVAPEAQATCAELYQRMGYMVFLAWLLRHPGNPRCSLNDPSQPAALARTSELNSLIWVAVKELRFIYHNSETILSAVYPYYGNFNSLTATQ